MWPDARVFGSDGFSLSEDPLGVSGPEWAGGAHLLCSVKGSPLPQK